ncbi:MAG: hypothetical protein IH840_08910 [Candidatus Heimdallarchaeota archaeon]|nr:hypothetical protein [Candidatus Heimdallarchaeota archaeon]
MTNRVLIGDHGIALYDKYLITGYELKSKISSKKVITEIMETILSNYLNVSILFGSKNTILVLRRKIEQPFHPKLFDEGKTIMDRIQLKHSIMFASLISGESLSEKLRMFTTLRIKKKTLYTSQKENRLFYKSFRILNLKFDRFEQISNELNQNLGKIKEIVAVAMSLTYKKSALQIGITINFNSGNFDDLNKSANKLIGYLKKATSILGEMEEVSPKYLKSHFVGVWLGEVQTNMEDDLIFEFLSILLSKKLHQQLSIHKLETESNVGILSSLQMNDWNVEWDKKSPGLPSICPSGFTPDRKFHSLLQNFVEILESNRWEIRKSVSEILIDQRFEAQGYNYCIEFIIFAHLPPKIPPSVNLQTIGEIFVLYTGQVPDSWNRFNFYLINLESFLPIKIEF